ETTSEREAEELLAEVRGLLEDPSLSTLFDHTALSEVPITANLDLLDGKRIHGVIDKLILSNGRVLAVDFKTNVAVPDSPEACPLGLLRQMGAYAHALRIIYPSHEIETAILWTREARLMYLPHDLVTRAVTSTYIS
ncbi:MAG: double-strand break repair helicase AddA, partial [Pseudomonadota bacterium]